MKTYVVQLEGHDDVISARDKVAWSKAQRVLLVWPRRGRVLRRSVDLLLVQRECRRLGAQLALVTRDPEVLASAGELGIPVFSSPEQAQKSHWRAPRGGRGANRLLPLASRRPADAQDLREKRRQIQPEPPLGAGRRLLVFAAGVLAFLALALFFLPGATITLNPVVEAQQISLPVWARPTIQAANPSGGMPARALSVVVEGRDQTPSSGTARAPEGYASVEVEFSNLGGQAVELPAGTIVSTVGPGPVRFATTRAVRLEAGPGKTQAAPARAVLPGPGGNVAAEQVRAVEGPVGLLAVVVNPRPASGGSERRVPAPTALDAQALREKVMASLESLALEELQAKTAPGQVLLEGSLRPRTVLEEEQFPALGQPGEILQLTLRVEYEAWYVEAADLQSVARAALDANLPAGYQPLPETFSYQLEMRPPQGPDDSPEDGFRGALSARRQVRSAWSRPDAVHAVTGRGLAEAAAILAGRLELASAPRIEVSPPWWGRLPYLPARITLVEP